MAINPLELFSRAAELMPLARDAIKAVDELIAASNQVANFKDGVSGNPEHYATLRRATDRVIEIRAKLPKDL